MDLLRCPAEPIDEGVMGVLHRTCVTLAEVGLLDAVAVMTAAEADVLQYARQFADRRECNLAVANRRDSARVTSSARRFLVPDQSASRSIGRPPRAGQ